MLLIKSNNQFIQINDSTKVEHTFDIEFRDFINHDNKLYGLNLSNNTLTIIDLSNNAFKIIMDIDIQVDDVSNLSNLLIAKDMYGEMILGYINNKLKTFEIYKLNEHHIPLLYTHRHIFLDISISTIDRILFQDGFFYLISLPPELESDSDKSLKNLTTHVTILKPDFSDFGQFIIPDTCYHSIMAGKYIFYTDNTSIKKYDILKKNIIEIISFKTINNTVCAFTFNLTQLYMMDNQNHLYIYNFDSTFPNRYILGETIFKIYEHAIETTKNMDVVEKMVQSIWGNDFQHTVSSLTKSYVHTYFPCQMDRNQKYINDILSELAINFYSNKDNLEILNHVKKDDLNLKHFRDIHKLIVFGNDLQDILEPPHDFFNKYYAYQHILNDMETLLNIKERSHLEHFIQFVKNKGIHINHPYTMSGRFHLMKPNHAKGWHNNIDSVPKGKAEVIYFVITDVHEYGGSFFLYQHPHSKMIHAVPDISGTFKKFYLIGDKKNTLWHAIGSFTANRISLGYSKRSDLELYEQTKKDIFN
jgi:hypothetical protein